MSDAAEPRSESRSESPPRSDASPASGRWSHALFSSAAMLAASYLVFVLVPNNLLSYLTLHTNPRIRDLLIVLWWAGAFVFGCWLFVRLQRGSVR